MVVVVVFCRMSIAVQCGVAFSRHLGANGLNAVHGRRMLLLSLPLAVVATEAREQLRTDDHIRRNVEKEVVTGDLSRRTLAHFVENVEQVELVRAGIRIRIRRLVVQVDEAHVIERNLVAPLGVVQPAMVVVGDRPMRLVQVVEEDAAGAVLAGSEEFVEQQERVEVIRLESDAVLLLLLAVCVSGAFLWGFSGPIRQVDVDDGYARRVAYGRAHVVIVITVAVVVDADKFVEFGLLANR